jgi:iron complex outermembrane receptor protein
MKTSFLVSSVFTVWALTLAGPLAQAESATASSTADAPMLEEITVTARKRAESIVDVPISITAVSGDALERSGATSLVDVAKAVPNLYVDQIAGGPRISMRGLGSADTSGVIDPSVGIGIDELSYSRPRWLAVGLFDVNSVEVLHGPQSTFFGKSTTAGLLNITTRNPGDQFEGYVRGGYEFAVGGFNGEGAFGGPVSETLGVRFAWRHIKRDGFLKLDDGSGTHDDSFDEDVGRLTVVWRPSDRLSATYKFTYTNSDEYGSNSQLGQCNAAMVALLKSLSSPEDCTINLTRSPGVPIPGGILGGPAELTKNHGFSNMLALKWDLGGDYSLNSVTGYHMLSSAWKADGDWNEQLVTFNTSRPEVYEQESQEFRLQSPSIGPIQYILGFYADNAKRTEHQDVDVSYFGTVPTSSTKVIDVFDRSIAGYGELTWNVSSDVRLLAGGRFTHERQDGHVTQLGGALGDVGAAAPIELFPDFDIRENRATNHFTPSVTVQWDYLPHAMWYASFREGFKSGGYALDVSQVIRQPDGTVLGFAYKDETAKSYEIGTKIELLDRTLLLTASIFDVKFSNMQVQSYPGNTPVAEILNAAAATSKGAELQVLWSPVHAISLNASVGYTHSIYDSFPNAPCYLGQTVAEGCVGTTQNLAGAHLPLAPKVTASIGADWRRELFTGHDVEVGAGATYRDQVQVLLQQAPQTFEPSLALFNANVGLVPHGDKGWSVDLVGRNIFNKIYAQAANGVSVGSAVAYAFATGLPRTVELNFEYRF